MLPRAKRLPHLVFTTKPLQRVRFEFGTVALYSDKSEFVGRAAVIVSKKVAKSSPLRNRIRRRVYAALRALSPLPFALAVYPTKEVATAPFEKIVASLAGALH